MRIEGIISCYRLLNRKMRRDYWIVSVLASFAALFEMIGIAAIIPVVSVLVDYEGAVSQRRMHWLFHLLNEPDKKTFLIILALAAIAAVWTSGIVGLLSAFASQRFLKRISTDISVRVYQKYMSHPIERFYGKPSSEFMRNVNGVSERVTNGVIGASITVIARSFQILVVAAVLFIVNFKVTLIILVVLGGSYAAIHRTLRHRIERMSAENHEEVRTLQQLVIGSYQAYRSIIIDQQLGSFVEHFRTMKKATSRKAADIEIIGSTPRQLIEVIGITLLIAASYIVGNSVQQGHQFVAVMALFGIAAYRMLPSAQQLYNAVNRIVAALTVYQAVAGEWEDLKIPPPIDAAGDDSLVGKPTSLEVRDLSYGFGTHELFNDLSMTLELTGVIRVAGDSGVGKSTFIELLAGLRQPHEGLVLLDGVQLTERRKLQWWSRISYVSQADYVYEGTIRQNVVLDRVWDEGRFALVAGICGLKTLSRNGVFDADQSINEAGTDLSGGQRSRIVLARALYKSTDVIFLDEVFAALDVQSAKTILTKIRTEFPERCLIVVSHREAELPLPFHTVSLAAAQQWATDAAGA